MSHPPLKGIKILDLTRLLPGPLATQYLADLGADVIKIEDIKYPDYTRFFPPQIGSQSVHFLSVNRSKKSLAMDLKTDEGRDVFFKLVEKADIVIEGFRPGKIDEMGLGYETARRFNTGIIYVSVSGYGQNSPMAGKAGHDLNYVGYAGLIALQGENGRMTMPGLQVADIMGGSYNAVIACLTALIGRSSHGEGDHIDVSMTDGALQMASLPLGELLNTGNQYGPGEFMLSGGLPNYHIYECADGKYVALGALEPKFWMAFCQMVDHPEWVGMVLPGSAAAAQLTVELKALFKEKSRGEWVAMAEGFDICLSPVLSLDEVIEHPHFKARGMILEHEHPEYGKVKSVSQPLRFKACEKAGGWAPPLLGEHSEAVLASFGFKPEEINRLLESGLIKQHHPPVK